MGEISTNLPVEADVYITAVQPNGFSQHLACMGEVDGCAIGAGARGDFDYSWNGRAPSGMWVLRAVIRPYTLVEADYTEQVQRTSYADWVGGSQAPKLHGNPEAVSDKDHPAVLDLQAVLTIRHP